MSEKEVIEQIESLIDDRNSFIDPTDKSEDNIFRKDKEALQTVLQLLEQKDTRIDELEKALVDEAIKSTEKIKELNNKINKVKEYCNETIDFKDSFNERYDDCYDILKMLEE